MAWTSIRPVYIYGPLNYNPVEEWFFHRIKAGRPYDLILANILARPLTKLAMPISRALAPGGRVVLSGLLESQERQVLGAYALVGLKLEARRARDGWLALVLAPRNRRA